MNYSETELSFKGKIPDVSTSSNQMKNIPHFYYLDYLRIIAIFSIVVLHTSAQLFNSENQTTHALMLFIEGGVRWGVNLFLMISGVLFLSKPKIEIRRILTKNVPRLVIAYLLFSLLDMLLEIFVSGNDFSVDLLIQGDITLWFIPVLIGIYLIVPVLNAAFHKNFSLLKYFISVFLIIEMNFWIFRFIASNFFGYSIPRNSIINFSLGITSYTAVFILGYFLANFINLRIRYLLLFFLFSNTLLISISYFLDSTSTWDNTGLFTILNAACLFLIFKRLKITNRSYKFWLSLSSLSFGIYLWHIPIIIIIRSQPIFLFKLIENYRYKLVLYIFAISIAIYILSAIFTFICKQIPGLKKIF